MTERPETDFIADDPLGKNTVAAEQAEQPDREHLSQVGERKWSIVTGLNDRLARERLRAQFERIVRQAVVGLGFQLREPSSAIDAWLDLLQKESPYSHDGWGIKDLRMASAEYSAELKTRALEADNAAQASVFSDLEQKFLELPDAPPSRDPQGHPRLGREGGSDKVRNGGFHGPG